MYGAKKASEHQTQNKSLLCKLSNHQSIKKTNHFLKDQFVTSQKKKHEFEELNMKMKLDNNTPMQSKVSMIHDLSYIPYCVPSHHHFHKNQAPTPASKQANKQREEGGKTKPSETEWHQKIQKIQNRNKSENSHTVSSRKHTLR